MDIWTNSGWDRLFGYVVHDSACCIWASIIVSMTIATVARFKNRQA